MVMEPASTALSDYAKPEDRRVPASEAAEILGVDERLLAQWRQKRRGPKWRKYGGKLVNGKLTGRGPVRYAISDLMAFADACIVEAEHVERNDTATRSARKTIPKVEGRAQVEVAGQ
jgi:hypothetical protein